MMKCVFALVLLHLCHSAVSSPENIERIQCLDQLIRSKPLFDPAANLTVPGRYMLDNPASCMSPFKTGLKNLLDSLSQPSVSDLVRTLRLKLETLEDHGQNNTSCIMETGHPNTALRQYMLFLRKHNNGRGQNTVPHLN